MRPEHGRESARLNLRASAWRGCEEPLDITTRSRGASAAQSIFDYASAGVKGVRASARLRLDPLDVARAALVLCRLVWLLRASAARRGGQLSGDPAVVARVGFDLARAVKRASAAKDNAEERRASLERAAASVAELASVVRVTDDMGALLRLAADLMVGQSPETPPRPPKSPR